MFEVVCQKRTDMHIVLVNVYGEIEAELLQIVEDSRFWHRMTFEWKKIILKNTHMFDVQTCKKYQCVFNIIYHFYGTMKQLMQNL